MLDSFLKRLFFPRFNEIGIFLMSFAYVLIAVVYQRPNFFLLEGEGGDEPFNSLTFILGSICLLSFYHILTTRKKYAWEKYFMVMMAALLSSIGGISAGMYMMQDSAGLLMIFPAWNIFSGAWLFLLFRLDVLGSDNMVDDNATPLQAVLGAAVIAITLIFCDQVLELAPVITFSICLAYSTNVNDVAMRYFRPRSRP
jgi:hypothetical protein